jgi:hypothetical protein
MTVADLIAKLQEMPQDAEVVCGDPTFGGAASVHHGARLMRAVPDGDRYRFIAHDADARANLRYVRPVVLVE